ncbi:MAG: hypothetical protein V7K64_04305 [Nostoc sp.]|uniref:hypothetical protein n=1 Tax=Nostoc sp. TaxID=1180 RepID=UPI002FF7C47F
MKNKIAIRPHKYLQFGAVQECNFYLVTEANLIDAFVIEQDNSYKSSQILTYTGVNFIEVIEQTDEPAHVLVICPEHFITSVEPHQLGCRKLAIMAVNSTPTSLPAIKHFLDVMETTDPDAQRMFANRFFDILEQSEYLSIVDMRYQTSASFLHFDDEYEWFEQGGSLDWGQQQIVPSGELSVLPLTHGEFSTERNLRINGQVAFWGYPILHSGKHFCQREEQACIYSELSVLKDHAVVATIEDGVIRKLHATHPSVASAKFTLERLFSIDSRYRFIWEVGFGINTALKLWPGNAAMNEVYGADYGVLHWGFGLTPFTQYHLDIICPHTKVLSNTGEIIAGDRVANFPIETKKDIVRNTVSGCPCTK